MTSEAGNFEGLRVAVQTFGCRSNFADTAELELALKAQGAILSGSESAADVYVINSCTVTDEADRETLRLMHRIQQRSPKARIVVTGCMAEVRDRDLVSAGADAVIGPGRKNALVSAIGRTPARSHEENQGKKLSVLRSRWAESLSAELPKNVPGPSVATNSPALRARYHVRIQEGCNHHCTFCIIPATRGNLVSRPVARVLEDIESLCAKGYNEIVLTGTHIGGYGEDIGSSLQELLRAIVQSSPPVRIRLSSIDPNEVDAELINILGGSKIFCPHLHLCFQALSDRILKLMNRQYDVQFLKKLCQEIFHKIQDVRIGADMITGFPSETAQEVKEQMDILQELGVSHLHVFPYSEREGTAATRLKEGVSIQERKRRAARWRALGASLRNNAHRLAIGKKLDVILESEEDASFLGTSSEYFRVVVQQPRQSGVENMEYDGGKETLIRGKRITAIAHGYDESRGILQCQF